MVKQEEASAAVDSTERVRGVTSISQAVELGKTVDKFRNVREDLAAELDLTYEALRTEYNRLRRAAGGEKSGWPIFANFYPGDSTQAEVKATIEKAIKPSATGQEAASEAAASPPNLSGSDTLADIATGLAVARLGAARVDSSSADIDLTNLLEGVEPALFDVSVVGAGPVGPTEEISGQSKIRDEAEIFVRADSWASVGQFIVGGQFEDIAREYFHYLVDNAQWGYLEWLSIHAQFESIRKLCLDALEKKPSVEVAAGGHETALREEQALKAFAASLGLVGEDGLADLRCLLPVLKREETGEGLVFGIQNLAALNDLLFSNPIEVRNGRIVELHLKINSLEGVLTLPPSLIDLDLFDITSWPKGLALPTGLIDFSASHLQSWPENLVIPVGLRILYLNNLQSWPEGLALPVGLRAISLNKLQSWPKGLALPASLEILNIKNLQSWPTGLVSPDTLRSVDIAGRTYENMEWEKVGQPPEVAASDREALVKALLEKCGCSQQVLELVYNILQEQRVLQDAPASFSEWTPPVTEAGDLNVNHLVVSSLIIASRYYQKAYTGFAEIETEKALKLGVQSAALNAEEMAKVATLAKKSLIETFESGGIRSLERSLDSDEKFDSRSVHVHADEEELKKLCDEGSYQNALEEVLSHAEVRDELVVFVLRGIFARSGSDFDQGDRDRLLISSGAVLREMAWLVYEIGSVATDESNKQRVGELGFMIADICRFSRTDETEEEFYLNLDKFLSNLCKREVYIEFKKKGKSFGRLLRKAIKIAGIGKGVSLREETDIEVTLVDGQADLVEATGSEPPALEVGGQDQAAAAPAETSRGTSAEANVGWREINLQSNELKYFCDQSDPGNYDEASDIYDGDRQLGQLGIEEVNISGKPGTYPLEFWLWCAKDEAKETKVIELVAAGGDGSGSFTVTEGSVLIVEGGDVRAVVTFDFVKVNSQEGTLAGFDAKIRVYVKGAPEGATPDGARVASEVEDITVQPVQPVAEVPAPELVAELRPAEGSAPPVAAQRERLIAAPVITEYITVANEYFDPLTKESPNRSAAFRRFAEYIQSIRTDTREITAVEVDYHCQQISRMIQRMVGTEGCLRSMSDFIESENLGEIPLPSGVPSNFVELQGFVESSYKKDGMQSFSANELLGLMEYYAISLRENRSSLTNKIDRAERAAEVGQKMKIHREKIRLIALALLMKEVE